MTETSETEKSEPEPLIAELRRIVDGVTINAPDSFTFAGNDFPVPGELTTHLQGKLYESCYCTAFPGGRLDDGSGFAEDDEFLQALSDANVTRDLWEDGWTLARLLPNGQISAEKRGTDRQLWPGEFLTLDGPGVPPRVGAALQIYSARESRHMQPGFYFAFSDSVMAPLDGLPLARFYWNITASGACRLTHALTKRLNRFGVPFRYKCLSHRAHYARRDAAVLFVKKRYFRIAAELAAEAYPSVADYLEPTTPLFTKRLAPGLGFAEDPMNGQSFGMDRCRLVAEGLWKAYESGRLTPEERLEEVAKQFAEHRLTLERPYLNPGSLDDYDFPHDDTPNCGNLA